MAKLKKFAFRLFIVFFILGIISSSIIAGILYAFYRQLPFVSLESYRQSVNSKIYDEQGRLILELFKDENRTRRLRLNEVSPYVINAVIAIEDRRFFNHYGIDLIRILKSAYVDLKRRRLVQGASTITQQLARNAFLSLEKRWSRKIKEIMLAFKLEHQFTKEEILELYLNEISFGEGSYGVESASQIFFGKSAAELEIHEAAMLAGVINAPTRNSPFRNYERAISRRNVVLRAMYDHDVISREELKENLEIEPDLTGRSRQLIPAPYYIYSSLLPELNSRYGNSMVNAGGLQIYTTINKDIQKIAEEEFGNAPIFEEHPDLNGAMLVLEVKTGKLLAVVGGKGFQEDDQYNRAFEATRQPGSVIKPAIYLAAFENGIAPNKIFSDVPREYFDPWTQTIWQPKNYEGRYHGPVILRNALENSYNIIAIELMREVGVKNSIEYTKKLGVESPMRETLSFALGSYEMTPLEVATMFSTLANGGLKVDISHLERISDIDGIEIESYDYSADQVVSPEATAIVNDILKGVVNNGSGTRAKIPGYNVAGKTGTTDEFTNAWFAGYTPNLLVVSYFGHDYPKHIDDHASGGRVAAPVVKKVMERILKQFPDRFPNESFPEPDNMEKVNICRESGLLSSDECQFTVQQLFIAGTEPTMKCNFHDPYGADMTDIDDDDLIDFFTTPQPEATMMTPFPTTYTDTPSSEPDGSDSQSSADTRSVLDKLKDELSHID
ncbi:MAG: transglycosylase domain-containing protein [Candidatus Muiribacteriota bacterium]